MVNLLSPTMCETLRLDLCNSFAHFFHNYVSNQNTSMLCHNKHVLHLKNTKLSFWSVNPEPIMQLQPAFPQIKKNTHTHTIQISCHSFNWLVYFLLLHFDSWKNCSLISSAASIYSYNQCLREKSGISLTATYVLCWEWKSIKNHVFHIPWHVMLCVLTFRLHINPRETDQSGGICFCKSHNATRLISRCSLSTKMPSLTKPCVKRNATFYRKIHWRSVYTVALLFLSGL